MELHTEAPVQKPNTGIPQFWWALLRGFAVCGAMWLFFAYVYRSLPYCRPGSDLVLEYKETVEKHGPMFRDPEKAHLAIIGTSKVLAGFIPDLFDRLMAESGFSVESYNLGLPAVVRFLPDLKRLAASGQAPDILLLTETWPLEDHRPTFFRFLDADAEIMQTLFPFRLLPRDYAQFLTEAPSRGGLSAWYRATQATLEKVIRERGYYFIAQQSLYRDARLPDDFSLNTDAPYFQMKRTTNTNVFAFHEFYEILQHHRIHCYYVPQYFRIHEMRQAAPSDVAFVNALQDYPLIRVLGPNYFSYTNDLFSDPKHVNPKGADLYTRALADLLKPQLSR